MLKLYSTGCPKCKVLKKKLEGSGKEYEVIEDLVEVNKFADEHNLREAPILVTETGETLNFKEALQYI